MDKFSEYYQKYASFIQPPSSIEKREFGFLLIQERLMLRHKSFRNIDDLRKFLRTTVPSDVYYSGAYYERPKDGMEDKGWLGADLLFDIDADHIPTPCTKVHDKWVCKGCSAVGRGVPPRRCPSCGEQRFIEKNWPCEVCLESAKLEAIKLIDILIEDFGLSSKEINVSFSGHRGYHIHIEREEVRELDRMARSEVADYLTGIGLEPRFHGLREMMIRRKAKILTGPNLNDLGWRGRTAKGTYELLLTATREDLKKIGLKKKVIDTLIRHKERLLESWKEKGPWDIVKGVGLESWKKLAQEGIKGQSVKIDTVVTTDIHRLIRLTNTLHGKTGLKKIRVPIMKIEGFDPFKSSVALKEGSVSVFVVEAPKFRLGDEMYGPYKEQSVELPTAVALLLLCKGAARMVE